MDIYKEAAAAKLRIDTPMGPLAPEGLFDLKKETLNHVAVLLDEEYNSSKKKSFLEEKTKKDKTVKLKLDIVLDVLQHVVDAENAVKNRAEVKAHNDRISALIAKKQEEELGEKSIEELEAMLKK